MDRGRACKFACIGVSFVSLLGCLITASVLLSKTTESCFDPTKTGSCTWKCVRKKGLFSNTTCSWCSSGYFVETCATGTSFGKKQNNVPCNDYSSCNDCLRYTFNTTSCPSASTANGFTRTSILVVLSVALVLSVVILGSLVIVCSLVCTEPTRKYEAAGEPLLASSPKNSMFSHPEDDVPPRQWGQIMPPLETIVQQENQQQPRDRTQSNGTRTSSISEAEEFVHETFQHWGYEDYDNSTKDHRLRPSKMNKSKEVQEQTIMTKPDIQLAVRGAKSSGMLHLAFRELQFVPTCLFHGLANLTRLDLANNDLKTIPPQIGMLSKLEHLWVNNNRQLSSIPDEITACTRLKTLDARRTCLKTLPAGVGQLKLVRVIDLRCVPTLKEKIINAYVASASENIAPLSIEDGPESDVFHQNPVEDDLSESERIALCTKHLIRYLKLRYDTKQLKIKLEERFRDGIYRELSDDPAGNEAIKKLVKTVFKEFTDLSDVKDVIRNCERLFPKSIYQVCVPKIHERFSALKKQNERKKLAASLELKLRSVYFDRIDPSTVEGIVRSIYAEIETLDDIIFLIKYAARIFPENAVDIDAKLVYLDLVKLQKQLEEERNSAIARVAEAIAPLYAHVEPKQIEKLANLVCKFFKRVQDIKKLAAGAAQYFPAEFETVASDPRIIRKEFVAAQTE